MSRKSGTGGASKKVLILAWVGYIFALAGAAALPATFLGSWIAWCVSHVWGWVGPALLLAGAVSITLDIALDLVPNRLAVWCTIAMPSIAAGIDGKDGEPGKLATKVGDASDWILPTVNDRLGSWLGTTSTIGICIGAIGAAWLVSRRTMATRAV